MNKNKGYGYTLIELMIVVVIIGVLMAYLIPSYERYVIQSKRTEAQTAILQIAAAEEKHNTAFYTYTTTVGGTGTDGNSLGIGSAQFVTSENYDFTITADAGYTITATAKGYSQIKDKYEGVDCTELTLDATGVKLPLVCWQ
jgi:type IV pilus assembly protein PilE